MNEQNVKVELFEGQEIKVITDKGETLYNLANTARILGLTKIGKSKNIMVNWKGGNSNVVSKLNTIYGSGTNVSPQYIEEVKYTLDEIDNGDNRNEIYISSWLSKRLAMECNNEKAMRYKNWLATLDEKYSKGELLSNNQDGFNQMINISQQMSVVANTMNQIGQAMIGIQSYVQNSIQSKDKQIDDIRELIDFRSNNTRKLSKLLKERLEDITGRKLWATSEEYKKGKEKLFKYFDVLKWEDIPVEKYYQVRNYILENY